jgi:hypothetical protein
VAVADDTGVRATIAKAVQWEPARNTVKYGVHAAARARGKVLEARGKVPAVANIYAGSCPKSGSQWAKALFDHPIVRSHTELITLPQLGYWLKPLKVFPAGTFVPGMYVSYDQYRQMPKPFGHRMVYVFRDPRDIVVSAYGSVETHRTVLDAREIRSSLDGKSMDEAMLWLIGNGEGHLRDMATWVGVEEKDESVKSWRLEDIQADPATAVSGMLAHCGVNLSTSELDTVLAETSREALQRKDLADRETGAESHYRVNRRSYRDAFKPEHYQALEKVVPGLIEQLGYAPSEY